MDNETAQELIRTLIADRQAYVEEAKRTQHLLQEALNAAHHGSSLFGGGLHPPMGPPTKLTKDALLRKDPSLDIESFHKDSVYTGEDSSELDDAESWFAQRPLEAEQYTEEGFKKHILEYDWTEPGLEIIQDVGDKDKVQELMDRPVTIFPQALDDSPDRSHITHYAILDVNSDGVPREIAEPVRDTRTSRSMGVWERIKSVNAGREASNSAVGRITTVREPSPLLFAALHYTMNKHFDMDELFAFLVDDDPALCREPDAFADDHRHQRSFVFTFEYFTIVGENCEATSWQKADLDQADHSVARTHIPISRCASILSLSLLGEPMGKVKNKHRRAKKRYGNVYDPFSPYHLLHIQSYPDWKSSLDTHDGKHYVNGPEAFLVALCDEYRDATKRLTAVYKAITSIAEPPSDFIFSLTTRDKLLFEDDDFTYSRRYFWSYNALGIMNEDIEDMIVAYTETFKECVWNGTDKIIWPGTSEDMASARNVNWRQRMKGLRHDIEQQIDRLKDIKRMNDDRMKMVKGLHSNLYNGTSVLESRKSVQNAMITVQQGNNIRLLTLVTIFFLPLTFVTSVFGMTAIPVRDSSLYHFAWATLAVCIPTYVLITSLNTKSGMGWWQRQVRRVIGLLSGVAHAFARLLWLFGWHPKWTKRAPAEPEPAPQKLADPIWMRPETDKRRQQMGHDATSVRRRQHLSPSDTLTIGERKQSRMLERMESPAAATGEKEAHAFFEDARPTRLRSSTQTANLTGSRPPHRPSIGVVPLAGQVLPPLFKEDTLAAPPHRRPTVLSIPILSPSLRAPDDAASVSSDSSRPDRMGMLDRLFQGRKKRRGDMP